MTASAIYSADHRVIAAVARIRAMSRRTIADHGDRKPDNGRNRTWRERINRASFAARWRVTFRSPEIEASAAMIERSIRCEVFAERNGYAGRAAFC